MQCMAAVEHIHITVRNENRTRKQYRIGKDSLLIEQIIYNTHTNTHTTRKKWKEKQQNFREWEKKFVHSGLNFFIFLIFSCFFFFSFSFISFFFLFFFCLFFSSFFFRCFLLCASEKRACVRVYFYSSVQVHTCAYECICALRFDEHQHMRFVCKCVETRMLYKHAYTYVYKLNFWLENSIYNVQCASTKPNLKVYP